MNTPTSRRRALASLVALPLVLSAAPLAGVASAATTATISSVGVPGGKVGPNAGYLDPNQGVSGTTAIARIALSNASVTVEQLVIKVSGPSISIFRDFATSDGFALYKDVGGAGFTAEDHAGGVVSDGLRAGTPSGGRTPLTIVGHPDKAKDAGAYFLTVHPATVNVGDRPFTVTIDADALTTSDSSTSNAAVSLPSLTVDSRAPTTPVASNNQISPQPRPPGTEDGYVLANQRTEADKLIAFYNSSTDVSLASLLVRPDGSKAVHPAPPFPSEVKVGDGTGRTKSVTVALNNQSGNANWVRAVDSVGNLSPSVSVGANDVTAPLWATWSVTISGGRVNATNQAAVGVSSSGTTTSADSNDTNVANEMFRLVGLDVNGSQIAFTNWVTASRANMTASVSPPAIDARPLGNTPTRIAAQSRLLDLAGNIQDIVTGPPVPLDLSRPLIVAVAPLVDAAPTGASANDTFRVFFSEPIDQNGIKDTNGLRQNCTSLDGNCVNNRLAVAAGSGTSTVNWGLDPAFDWATDGMSGTITLGTDQSNGGVISAQPRLPKVDDIVTPNVAITDLNGNTIPNVAKIADPGLLPSVAETRDTGGTNLFAQGGSDPNFPGGDGRVDVIDITMSGQMPGPVGRALDPASFRVTGSAGALTPASAVLFDTGLNKIRLTLPDSTMLTGEVPLVSLVEPTPGAGTGLTRADGKPVLPFVIASVDKARPALIDARTTDADGDGHISELTLTFSEPINHDREENLRAGYTVTGYQDGALSNNTRTAETQTGFSNTSVLNLKEKTDDFDTEVLPGFSYIVPAPLVPPPAGQTAEICDAALNCRGVTGATAFTNTLADPYFDAARPVIVARKTLDLDADGYVDTVGVQFSEPLRTDTIVNATFTVTDRTGTGVVPVFVGNPDTLYVRVAEATTADGDTAAKLKLQYTGGADGGAHDAAVPTSNPARTDAAAVESVDGAGPAIVAATTVSDGAGPGDGTKVKVFLSEATEQLSVGDFSVAGISKASGQSVTQEPTELTIADDKKSVVLTLANAIDPAFDGTVEFTGPGAVADQVTPTPNLNVQDFPIPIPPFPVALLDAKGPAGSNDGYSISKTFTTGAAGNSGVSGWCLKVANIPLEAEPQPPATADDACFSLETPATHTVPIDGTYRLLLVTKNRFGNLSAPATDTIVVDSSAPGTTSVFLERLGAGRTGTVRDNDQVRVVVTTTGSGPSGWTATADYSALTGNPGHTAVPFFSRSGGTFNFPFRVASGTTVYPVGTVLAVNNDAGQPFVLEDGPDGQVVKRRFLSAQAMSTYRIPSSLVIRVPSAVVNPIPTGTTKYYRDGQLVRANGSPAVYVITENEKRLIPSRAVFEGMGYSFSSVVVVPAADLAKVPAGDDIEVGKHPVGTYVRNNTRGDAEFGRTFVILRGADGELRKRHVVSSTALLSHITINQVVNVAKDHTSLEDVTTDALKRGMRDGMLVREPNDPRVFAVSRGARRHINSRGAFELMGFSFRNVVVVGPEHVGIPVNSTVPVGTRRVPFSVTVRDAAGNQSSQASTVVGLGIPEPLPETAPGAPRP